MEKTTAVLLLAYGGPETPAEIEPFLKQLLRRDSLPSPMIQRVVEKYQTIGGGSPLPRICRSIREKLAAKLAVDKRQLPVYLAFRYSSPNIASVTRQMAAAGIERILAVSLSPHASLISTTAYFTTLEEITAELTLDLQPVKDWYRDRHFIDCLTNRITAAADKRSLNLTDADTAVVFSAHNIPASYLEQGDPYVREIKENITLVMARFPGCRHFFGYQSKGKAPGAWLEPEIENLLADLINNSIRKIILVPVSFAMDHMETLYDLDQEIIPAITGRHDVEISRIAMCNDDDDFIAMLSGVINNHG
ncbi:MAG: ferrochelatase [Deltaproteobacteria bacterium]|nr:ferrochelatase [Candidatus Anaeroferrophillus wilburensis]MBN2888350.1 ferrochelatase [Deltaproteobacteria bacterium]